MKAKWILCVGTALSLCGLRAFGEDAPNTNWVTTASLGFTLTSGNSDSVLGTAGILTGRKRDKNEWSFGADGAYGKTTDHTVTPDRTTKSAELARGFGQYNRLFSDRFFGYARAEGLHDGVALIRYRVTLSPGAGYYFIKNKSTDLCGELGPGYLWDDVGGVTRHYATLRVGEKFNQQLSAHAKLWQTAEYLPQLEDFNNFIVNAEIGVQADLNTSGSLALRVYLQDTYNNVPAAGRKQNDIKFVTALACKF